MIQVTPQTRILLCLEPVDFRRGIDGLAQICRSELSSEPFSGAVFVFRNRRATAIKLLTYDGQGYWLCQKRLSEGRFGWWPQTTGEAARTLAVHELQMLLWNGNPDKAAAQPVWRRVSTAG
jgi:transposase